MDLAIVGLPQSGKTTVFAALAAGHGSSSAGARVEHLGAVKIPDERLDRVGALMKSKKVTPLEVILHDLPAVFHRGAQTGHPAGPSGEAGESLARADGLLHVVRAFHREDVPHPEGSVDPARDAAAFDAELVLNDLALIERRLGRLDIQVRSAPAAERETGEREHALLIRCKSLLEGDKPLREQITDPGDLKLLAGYTFLSLKPMLLLLNIGEAEVARTEEIESEYAARLAGPRIAVAAMCARLESELAELTPEEAAEFRAELGVGEGAARRVLTRVVDLLGLLTFFTTGEKETRAWTLPRGATALQAAGRVHTDMERGFIRAEVVPWDTLIEFGSHAEARRHGRLRTEGKNYFVQDGDVINVLFSV